MCFNFSMSISAVLKPKSAFMQIPANADILSLAWQSKCIINLQIHFVNWYQHRTVLPLGKHVAFINESFFPDCIIVEWNCVSQELAHSAGFLLMFYY